MGAFFGVRSADEGPLDPTLLSWISAVVAPGGRTVPRRDDRAPVELGVVPSDGGSRGMVTERIETRDGTYLLAGSVLLDDRRDRTRGDGRKIHPPEISDGRRLLRRYLSGGVERVRDVEGEYAYLLWDPRRRRLIGGRDPFGIRPLYYVRLPGGGVVASSALPLLVNLRGVSEEIDRNRVADYLAGICTDDERTFYSSISRLSPGGILAAGPGGLEIRRADRSRLRPGSRDVSMRKAANGLRNRFERSVLRRAKGRSTGLFLSGGLDSSSIAGMLAADEADGRAYDVFSAVYDDHSGCDERTRIAEVVRSGPFRSHRLQADSVTPLEGLRSLLEAMGEPFLGYHSSVTWRLMSRARDRGVSVLLHGHGGDEVVSHGLGHLDQLARDRRWLRLARELPGAARIHGESALTLFLVYLGRYGPGRWLPASARKAGARLLGLRSRPGRPLPDRAEFIRPELVRETKFLDRYRAWRSEQPPFADTEQEDHFRRVVNSFLPHTFEMLWAFAQAHSLEIRYPFWDRSVVDLCLALPGSAKLKDGWGRCVLRRAMQGAVPESVLWNRRKAGFGLHFLTGLRGGDRRHLEKLLESDLWSERFVRADQFRETVRAFLAGEVESHRRVMALWRVVVLEEWLRMRAEGESNRPSIEGRDDRFLEEVAMGKNGRVNDEYKPDTNL